MDQSPDDPYSGEQQLTAARQAKQFLLGLLGDNSVSAEEMDQLREIIRDPGTLLGQRAREIHQRLQRIWDTEPNAYPAHRKLLSADTGDALTGDAPSDH